MHVVRPVRLSDLDRLLELAELTSFGLTTLPKDRSLLERRIKESIRSFAVLDDSEPRGQAYLFVMEDLQQQLVLGTCGIVSKVGGFEPFYSYRIHPTVHESKMLGVRKEIQVLHLEENHNGPCEIGSLFLHPDGRQGGNGRTLSLSRFLFMAEYPAVFDPGVIAEMRGVIDERGQSPFWDALGKHFFDLEFPKADYLSIVNKEFIGDLMPRHPIYIPLLPPEAQAVIGEVHELTRPARRLLESEGFQFYHHVDIFEAGPMLYCLRKDIRTVRESRIARVAEIVDSIESAGADELLQDQLIASRTEGFCCCRGAVRVLENGEIEIDREIAGALQVQLGDKLRFAPLREAT